MLQRPDLRCFVRPLQPGQGRAQVAEQRPQRAQRRWMPVQPEGGRRRAVLRRQGALRRVAAKLERRPPGRTELERVRLVRLLGQQQLARAEPIEQVAGALPERRLLFRRRLEFGHVAGARRDVGCCQAEPQSAARAIQRHRGAGRGFARLEQGRFQRRARRDHPHHAALDQPARGARLLQLFADRHPVALGHQPGQVLLHGAHRHPRQGHAQPAAHRLRGQGDVEFLGDQRGVLVEGLVEVAQPKKRIASG